MALNPGTRIGPYEIGGQIGAGGMGEVYRAQDTRLDRLVAIKVLRSDIARELQSRERFEAEARAISRLNHPHICTLYDVGRAPLPGVDDLDFLVMELVEGEVLGNVVGRGPLTAAQVVHLGLAIAAALEEAHAHGVLHGDLKPGNIMVTKFGPKLLDFGLARQLALVPASEVSGAPTEVGSGAVAGTLPYVSPEVLRGGPPDARSDLWALGVVLHEMATGVRPFGGQTTFELSAAILDRPPAPAPVWVPFGLHTIISRCLAKSVDDRYQRAGEVRAALEAVQSDPSIVPPAQATAHNLPSQLTRFIGREREIAEVKRLVETERLVTLTGAGGAGKTRLALQLAQDVADAFHHGVWLIELAPLTDPELIPHAIASTLGMRQETTRGGTAALLDFLRPRATLLVLDNCEHVIAACASLAGEILRACPRVCILATSREALAIAGERAWRVPSLALPDLKTRVSTDLAARSDAVRFFVDRAQAVAPHFALSPDTAPIVVRICHRLDGIPLALELAAARMKVLSVDQIAARLDNRFQLLTGGSRTAMPRQQTLRATIDWSYELLSEDERRLLRRLSVFVGGWSLEAAEQVCGGDPVGGADTIELLSHLIEKSLVDVEDDVAGGRRYRLLETVRQYARDRLFESGEAAALRGRHFQFFSHLAFEAEPELMEGSNQRRWTTRLAADHENLAAALEWGLAAQGGDETPLRMACALWSYWNRRNHFGEGRQWVERALAAAPDAPRALRAQALAAAADFSYLSGDHEAASAFCRDVLALDELGLDGPRWPVAFAVFILAVQATDRNEVEMAARLADRCVAVAREADAPLILGLALVAPQYVAIMQGDYDRALASLIESMTLLRPRGDKWILATVLYNVCEVLTLQGQHERAVEAGREGVACTNETGDRRSLTWCLGALATVAVAQGLPRRGARLWGAAEGLSQSIGSPLPPFVREFWERYARAAQQALGDESFAAEWTAGRQLTPDAAIVYALRDDPTDGSG